MGYMATWGPKGFLTSTTKVVPMTGLSTSFALKKDTNSDTSGSPATNTRGRELQAISFETVYMKSLGVDPRGQIEEWNNLIGAAYPLFIGGKQFGPAKMQLTKADVSDIQITPTGDFLSVKIGITLEEYQQQAAPISTKKATGGANSASKTGTSTTTKTAAATAKNESTEAPGMSYAEAKTQAKAAKATTENKKDLKPRMGELKAQ